MAYDTANDRLIVVDGDNHRVVFYDLSDGTTNGEPAVNELGQADMSGNSCNPGEGVNDAYFCYPTAVEYDAANDRLFVSDNDNSRVLVFNSVGPDDIEDGQSSSEILGQTDGSGNNCNVGGDVSDYNLCYPRDVLYEPVTKKLYVSDEDNNRVLIFNGNIAALDTGDSAIDLIGQADFDENFWFGMPEPNDVGMNTPGAIAIDSVNHRLFVADRNNARVLAFNLDSNDKPLDKHADYVIGQADLNSSDCPWDSGPLPSETDMCFPIGLAFDSTTERLFVTDRDYNRITVYDVSNDNIEDGMAADNVLGQEGFDTGDANTDGRDADVLSRPFGLAIDESAQMLYVGDRNNHRVLGYHVDAITDGEDATRVLGQANFTAGNCNRGGGAGGTDQNTLCYPRDVAINPITKQLFVSDGVNEQTEANRVLEYDVGSDFLNGENARHVLGQPDFESNDCNNDPETEDISARTMCNPLALAVDQAHNKLYVGDEWNCRVLVFNSDPDEIEDGANAIQVFGQADFESDNCDLTGDASEIDIDGPLGAVVNQSNDDVWIVDAWNNRVLGYTYEDILAALPSEWAYTDNDGDNIADSVEDAGPNDGDANDDGIPDSQQQNVSSFVDPVTEQYAVLEVDDSCSIQAVSVAAESTKAVQDTAFDYPAGLMNFTINCDSAGFTATITQYFYGVNATDLVVRKYNTESQTYTAITGASVSADTIDSKMVAKAVYQITDGSELDQDGLENSTIVDPSGVASTAVGAPNTGLGGR